MSGYMQHEPAKAYANERALHRFKTNQPKGKKEREKKEIVQRSRLALRRSRSLN